MRARLAGLDVPVAVAQLHALGDRGEAHLGHRHRRIIGAARGHGDPLIDLPDRHAHRGPLLHPRQREPGGRIGRDQPQIGALGISGPGTTAPGGLDAAGSKPNRWRLFERLDSMWRQAKRATNDRPREARKSEPGVVRTPSRRTRTPLTQSEVDSIRTARADGESVVSISRRFGIHRMTVWTHTKDLVTQTPPTRRTPEADIVDTIVLRRN